MPTGPTGDVLWNAWWRFTTLAPELQFALIRSTGLVDPCKWHEPFAGPIAKNSGNFNESRIPTKGYQKRGKACKKEQKVFNLLDDCRNSPWIPKADVHQKVSGNVIFVAHPQHFTKITKSEASSFGVPDLVPCPRADMDMVIFHRYVTSCQRV